MSSGKHTPGPWVAIETRVYFPKHAGGFDIRNCPNPEANARLIAAAPELLEAAKLVIAWYEAEDDHSKADFYQRMEMCRQSEAACRAAIAKATGATNV